MKKTILDNPLFTIGTIIVLGVAGVFIYFSAQSTSKGSGIKPNPGTEQTKPVVKEQVSIKEVLQSTRFDTNAVKRALKTAIDQHEDTVILRQYYMICGWVNRADAVIRGEDYKKMEIVQNLGYLLNNPKFSFLNSDQRKDIQFYKDIVSYMNGFPTSKNAEGVMRNMKFTHSAPRRAEIGNFLMTKGLWNGQ